MSRFVSTGRCTMSGTTLKTTTTIKYTNIKSDCKGYYVHVHIVLVSLKGWRFLYT